MGFINGLFKLVTALTGLASLAESVIKMYREFQEKRKAEALRKDIKNATTTEELADASVEAKNLFHPNPDDHG